MRGGTVLDRYPLSMRILHWVIGLAIVGQFAAGWYMAEIPDDAPDKYLLYPWHQSFGLLLLLLVLLRFGNRLRSLVPPLPAALPHWESIALRAVHYLMYVLMVVTPVAGYVMSAAYPESSGIEFFGLPLPQLVEKNETVSDKANEVHVIAAFSLIGLALLHMAAALKHRFFDPPEADVLHRII